MTEYRTISFMRPAAELLGSTPGGVAVQTIDILGTPGLGDYIDGWEIVTFQIVPAGEWAYLVLFLRSSAVPDSASALDEPSVR